MPRPERARSRSSAIRSARRSGPKPSGGCKVSELFRVLGKAHVLDILHIFYTEPVAHRFVDLQGRLRVSPNTLSERLKDLVDAGLLTRTAYNEIPPRVDYTATRKALELAPVFRSLEAWADRFTLTVEMEAAPLAA